MKRKLLAMVCAVSMIASLGAATVYASDDVKATGDEKIALITMDSIDQHWITLNEGAQEEAKALGVTVDFMSPNTKDDAQQIECVNNAVAGGYDAIMVAANGILSTNALANAEIQMIIATINFVLEPLTLLINSAITVRTPVCSKPPTTTKSPTKNNSVL